MSLLPARDDEVRAIANVRENLGGREDVVYNPGVSHEGLPGGDLIRAGIEDLAQGVESVPALLVSIGAPRLRRLGLAVERPIPAPERRIYDLLHRSDPGSAHSRYNALIRRLVSYERAAECAR